MRIILSYFFCMLFIVNYATAETPKQPTEWYSKGPDSQVQLNVDLFVTSTCPHCHKADAFLQEAIKNHPWLHINRYVINQDKSALKFYYERLQQLGSTDFSVPSIFFCNSRWVGFDKDDTSGFSLLNAMKYCRYQITKEGTLNQGTIKFLQAESTLSQVQISKDNPPYLFVPISGLIDGIASCSFFSLLAFLAYIWLSPNQKSRQITFGLIYILTLAFIRLSQQLFTTTYYQIYSAARLPALIFGLFLLGYLTHSFLQRRSQKRIKPSAILYACIILTAIFVQGYQQVCAFNMGLIFKAWVDNQALTMLQHMMYYSVYLFFYILPLTLFLLIYVQISHFRRFIRFQSPFYIAGLFILMVIAILLIIHPFIFANVLASLLLFIVALLMGWITVKLRHRYEKK